jgi:hypothetical protein
MEKIGKKSGSEDASEHTCSTKFSKKLLGYTRTNHEVEKSKSQTYITL